jgi:hypothetical protein
LEITMTMETQTPAAIEPELLQAAKEAVRTVYSFRHDLADTGTLEVFLSEAREISKEARAQGRKIAPEDWIYLAGLADDVCDDDGLPRLFDIERPLEVC